MNQRRIKPRGTIGELHIARARLQRVFQKPRDFCQQRAFRRRRHFDAQAARHVERAGIDRDAALGGDMASFAGDQALVDLGAAFDHHAIDRAALAGAQQHDVAGLNRCNRHFADLIWPDKFGGGFRLQRGEIAGDRAGALPHLLIKEPPRQQEGEQHDRCIEISVLGVIDGFHQRHRQCQDHADRDRHVHIDAAGAQRLPGRFEERLAGIGRARQHH